MTPLLLLLVPGCTDPFQVEAVVLSDPSTVVEVTWDPRGGGEAWVEYGTGEDLDRATPAVTDGEGRSRALLLGLHAFEDVRYRVVADGGATSREGEITTAGLPAELPDSYVLGDDGTWDRYLLATTWAAAAFVVVLDAEARVVWYHRIPDDQMSVMVGPVDGTADVLYLESGRTKDPMDSALVRVAADGVETLRVPVFAAHHLYAVRDDGVLGLTVASQRETEWWGTVVGDDVVEVDLGTGLVTPLVSLWDVYDLDLTGWEDSGFYEQGFDWTHANGIAWCPERGSWWVTVGGMDQVLEIDAVSGAARAAVGGQDGYAVRPEEAAFGGGFGPHAPTWTPDDTLLLFDNAQPDGVDVWSRVLEFSIDDDADAADLVWEYDADRQLTTASLGSTWRTADGDTVASYGNTGEIRAVAPDGGLRWQAQVGAGLGNAVPVEDLYTGR